MSSMVSRPPAADPARALAHFEGLLEFETDCWDVHHAIVNDRKDFVLLDVRGEALFNKGHIEGAENLHTRASMKTALNPIQRKPFSLSIVPAPTAMVLIKRQLAWPGLAGP